MNTNVTNECKTSRKAAKLSQVKAADSLHISQRVLSAYENGQRVPEEILVGMSKVYHNPEMLTNHCSKCPIGKKLSERAYAADLSAITVQLENQKRIFNGVIDSLSRVSRMISPVSMDIKRAAPGVTGVAQ